MFLEPHFKGQRSGWIEVICGAMFSGKTEELIRRLNRARIAHQAVVVVKPALDTRYRHDQVVSHNANSLAAIPVEQSGELLDCARDAEVLGIDEAQFFDMDLHRHCQTLAMKGVRVIAAGLDMDYRGEPFGPMPMLLAVAEYITKVHAICQHCGNLATHSFRLLPDTDAILLGEQEAYEARCRTCFAMGNILPLKPPGRKS